MKLLAIDPGPAESAFVLWESGKPQKAAKMENSAVMGLIHEMRSDVDQLVIEKIASYGMAVGAEVFETVFWSGRFAEAFGADRTDRIPRLDVKLHLCKDSRAKDGNIRQALIDRFGAPGTKKQPGALFGFSGDMWAALAVAVTWSDKHAFEIRPLEPGLF